MTSRRRSRPICIRSAPPYPSRVPTYKLTIAYDGSAFHGWQKQEVDPDSPSYAHDDFMQVRDGRAILRTVQEVLEQGVRRVVREPIVIRGASRTDAGVHAWSQVASFTSEPRPDAGVGWPADRGCDTLVRAINSRLPSDVLVRDAQIVPCTFDPIADCQSKGYSYTFHVGNTRPLWDRARVYHTWHELDAHAMGEAASLLVGEHDFAAFAAINHNRKTTVRTIHACEVIEAPGEGSCPGGAGQGGPSGRIRLEVSGSGFLYNMVRIIAGTLHEVGRGKMDPADIPAILRSGDCRCAGPTLPPQGLCLDWIRYRAHKPAPGR